MCPRRVDEEPSRASSSACEMGRECTPPLCSVAECSDSDSGCDDGASCLERGLHHAKSWPMNSAHNREQLRSAVSSALPRSKSIRFADSFGLPLVSVLHYRQRDSVEEFRDCLLSRKIGCSTNGWSKSRAAMEEMWSMEDDLELSVARSWGGPGTRANSWDLPSTRRLRRVNKHGQSKLSHSEPSASSSGKSEPRLRLEGDALSSILIRDRVNQQHVSLQYVSFQETTVFGSVIVGNVAFEKSVSIRYTMDKWKSSSDISATHVVGSTAQDGSTDRFSFSLVLPASSNSDTTFRMEFAICYKASSAEHWDSNSGANYAIVCHL